MNYDQNHKLYSQKPLKDLPKEHSNFYHYLVLFFHFSNIASNECWELNFFRNLARYFDSISLVWLSICSYKIRSNGLYKSGRVLTGLIWLIMTVFFLIYFRYISIFQLISECWTFDALIETFCSGRCYYVGAQLESLDWYITFWRRFFTFYIIDFIYHSHNIKIFKRKYFWIFKRTFYS